MDNAVKIFSNEDVSLYLQTDDESLGGRKIGCIQPNVFKIMDACLKKRIKTELVAHLGTNIDSIILSYIPVCPHCGVLIAMCVEKWTVNWQFKAWDEWAPPKSHYFTDKTTEKFVENICMQCAKIFMKTAPLMPTHQELESRLSNLLNPQ